MASDPASTNVKSVYLVPHPKIVFLYPTFILALIAGIYSLIAGQPPQPPAEPSSTAHMICLAFLVIFGLNMAVLSFDFPRTTSLTLFFAMVALITGLVLLFKFYPGLAPNFVRFIAHMNPIANATFYFLFAGILALLYLAVIVNVQFDWWEVRQNELLHHHGIWSNLERFAAPNLRIDKEINDVFEYMLLGAGRLVLHPSEEPRAIVLDNVFFINRKEQELTRLLGALQVQIRTDDR